MNDCTSCPFEKTLMRHLLVKCAPVLLGNKPAVLLRLGHCRDRHCDTFRTNRAAILARLGLHSRIIHDEADSTLVLFYRRERLGDALSEHPVARVLDRFNYPANDVESALDRLSARFAEEPCPHEIGFFLGYPFKDVAGFIYLRDRCRTVPHGQWRVFGNPAPSLQRMAEFRDAEFRMAQQITA